MAEGPYQWRRLAGEKPDEDQPVSIQIDGLTLVPSSQSADRAENALPGTNALPAVLELVPPARDPDLVTLSDPEGKRDYPPDPVADWSLTFRADDAFACAGMATWLHARHDLFARPTHHVRTPDGQITFLASSDGPSHGVALMPAWSLAVWMQPDEAKILAGAEALKTALAGSPARFASPDIRPDALRAQLERVAGIEAIQPRAVVMTAYDGRGVFHDGRKVWDLLHQLGLTWGDMDSFQRVDPTHQTDYLIWAEVDDGDLGYALPERIAAGAQHFRAIRFSFEIGRSPAPVHVLGQLERVVSATRRALGFDIAAFLDSEQVFTTEELRAGVDTVVARLDAFGVKPGSAAAHRLL